MRALIVACLIALLSCSARANLVEVRLSAAYSNDYDVVVTVVYDDRRRNPRVRGFGVSSGIDRVAVDIFQSGELIYSVINVSAGNALGPLVDIQLDPATGNFRDGTPIRLGDISAAGQGDDLLLSGNAGGLTSLIDVTTANSVATLNPSEFDVTDPETLTDVTFISRVPAGWTVIGRMTYDAAQPKVEGLGTGFTSGIDRLDVQLYNPAGTFTGRDVNVDVGVSNNPLLKLEFDTAEQRLTPGSEFELALSSSSSAPRYFGTVGGFARLVATDFNLFTVAESEFLVVDNNRDLDDAWYRLDFDGGWSIGGLIRYDNRLELVAADGALITDGIEQLTMTPVEPDFGDAASFGAVGFWSGSRPELDLAFEPMTQTFPAGPFAIGNNDSSDFDAIFVSGDLGGSAALFNFGAPLDTTTNANMFIVPTNRGVITVRFRLDLDGGWSLLGTMAYDSDLALVGAFGAGPTTGIESLDLDFVDPAGRTVFQQAAIAGGVALSNVVDVTFDTRLADFDPRSFVQLGSFASGEPLLIGDGRSFGELTIGGSTVDSVSVTRLEVDFRCSAADLVAPLAIINARDVEAMVTSPVPTFAEPFDVDDFLDVLEFLRLVDAGCP